MGTDYDKEYDKEQVHCVVGESERESGENPITVALADH